MIFGIKTRKDLQEEIAAGKNRELGLVETINSLNNLKNASISKINWYEELFNRYIFENTISEKPENSKMLVIDNYTFSTKNDNDGQDDTQTSSKYNATLYLGEEPYLYLSKKLTEGYKYLSVNFINNNIRFYLNNDNIGMEIDTNNRVRNKTILLFLQSYLGLIDGKVSIFFEKI